MNIPESRLLRHWNTDDFFRVSLADALKMGFKNEDALFLANVGLPNWAAPNIWLHRPNLIGPGRILIGEDRDDRKIVYQSNSGNLVAESEDGDIAAIATNLLQFLNLLADYAELVEISLLRNGEDAFIDNRIPSDLVDAFESQVKKHSSIDLGRNSFWNCEIARLRGGS